MPPAPDRRPAHVEVPRCGGVPPNATLNADTCLPGGNLASKRDDVTEPKPDGMIHSKGTSADRSEEFLEFYHTCARVKSSSVRSSLPTVKRHAGAPSLPRQS